MSNEIHHTERLAYATVAPQARESLLGVERYLNQCGLEKTLIELVKTRASQLNQCAFCLHMHTRDARRLGETEERLYLLSAWRESTLFTGRERAALGWTEALTLLATASPPDAAFGALRAFFTDKEIADLTTLIGQINTWNRIAVGLRLQHPVKQ